MTRSEPSYSDFVWESSAMTDTGRVRKLNQDAYLEKQESALWVVADGMGGHDCGEVASKAVTDALKNIQLPDSLSGKIDSLEATLKAVNYQLLIKARKLGPDSVIGTTVVLMFAHHDRCMLLWAGDSRAYRFRDGHLQQLTKDHSYVQQLVDKGLLGKEEAEHHPFSNLVTYSVGTSEALYIDFADREIAHGDLFLLCSDGLNKELNDDEITRALSIGGSLKEMNQTLIEQTLIKGGHDNVTCVLIRAKSA
jgi:serine/threonine protein phosphatase PrpC